MRTSLNNIISADILPTSQIDLSCMYIEISQTIKVNEINAYMQWIHATYRIFTGTLKSGSQKMRILATKKGKCMESDSP